MTAPEDQTVSSARSSAGCNPDDLPELFPDCTSSSENKTINFFVNTVYNNNSPIFDYCPGVSLDVTYTLWDCPGTNPITAISNLTYDLADLTNACPALAQAIQDAENAGTIQIVDLLDQLDFDISSQLEYQIVYEAMETQKVDCEEMEAIGIKVISDVCYTWHYRTGLGGGKGGGRYTKVLCDNSVCCIRSTAYCGNYDANGVRGIKSRS